MRLLMLSLIVALLVTLGSANTDPRFNVEISITATGQKTAGAKSAEVEVAIVHGDDLLEAAEQNPDWERRGDMLISYKRQPTTLRYRGATGSGTVLLFARHAYSGQVDVTIGDRREHYDLYSESQLPALSIRPLDWTARAEPTSEGVVGRWLLLFVLVFGGVYGASRWLLLRPSRPLPTVRPSFWPLALPSLCLYGCVLLAFWPGQLSPDSLTMWRSIQTGQFSDAAPVLLSWVYWLMTRVWLSPTFILGFQIVALSVVSALALVELRLLGVPRAVVWVMAFLVPAVPANSLMVTTLWKDVPYTIAAVYVLVLLLRLLHQDQPTRRAWRVGFVVALFALMMTRHNGLLLAVGLPIGVALFLPRERRFFLSASGALFCGFVVMKTVVFPATGVEPLGPHYRAMTAMHLIAAHQAAGTPLVATEEALLGKTLALPEWARAYRCQENTPLFFHPQIDWTALGQSAPQMNQLAWSLTLRAPQVSWAHQRCATSILWRLFARADERLMTVPFEVFRSPETDDLGIVADSKWPALRRAMMQLVSISEKPALVWFTWRPAFWLISLLYAAGLMAIARRDARCLLLTLPSVLNTLSLVPVIPSPDFRYQYCVLLSGLLLLPLLFVAGRHEPS